jgi:SAM-dependent methyltransferase
MLDWGCGSGRTWLWLQAYPAWRTHYYGCDVDTEAIEWLKVHGQTQVLLCQVLPPLPYVDAFFAGLFAFSVLTHILPAHHRTWYTELHRVLAPNSLAYITQHGSSIAYQSTTPRAVTRAFDQQGYSWFETKRHYLKGSSIVSEQFTYQAVSKLFEVVEFKALRYQDTYLLWRLP